MHKAFAPPQTARRGSRERELRLLRQECRGLFVCSSSGRVLARRFHKFFNIGETPQSSLEARIDFILKRALYRVLEEYLHCATDV